MPKASIGRIVHYVSVHGCRPAQILAVFDQPSGEPLLNLIVTLDGINDKLEVGGSYHTHRVPLEGQEDSETYGGPAVFHVWRSSTPHAVPFDEDANVQPRLTEKTWHWPERED